ncbi:Kynureninase [Smittium mucronatum]|uniref:Kynureninase n=1 Tax=Smittium mucronatum TaxID=133383 RepID=A0A1R0GSX1_9FUNG|nr:Kynureninase [Smittium mucronatum]
MDTDARILSLGEYILNSGLDKNSLSFAKFMDDVVELRNFRNQFEIPTVESMGGTRTLQGTTDQPCIYFSGNSLGLMPKKVRQNIAEELDVWAKEAVHAHFSNRYGRPWVSIEESCAPTMENIVGAKSGEVTLMNSLTVNMHLLFVPFYNPTPTRYKLLMEDKAFPSDDYAAVSFLKLKNIDPETAIIRMRPRYGEKTLRTEDILRVIRDEGDSIALIWFPGVQYYTGQFFEMEKITKAGHEKGCIVGFDLAHAVGNVPLKLHDWNVDFAVWCTYKYLNSCGGSVGGAFVHEKYARDFERNRLIGWWSHKLDTRFNMDNKLDLCEGIDGFRISNKNVLSTSAICASLDVFAQTSVERLRQRSLLLTNYLEILLNKFDNVRNNITIITPKDPEQRGSQLSLGFNPKILDKVSEHLLSYGVIADVRRPDCIRAAPTALYNTFQEIYYFVIILNSFNFD